MSRARQIVLSQGLEKTNQPCHAAHPRLKDTDQVSQLFENHCAKESEIHYNSLGRHTHNPVLILSAELGGKRRNFTVLRRFGDCGTSCAVPGAQVFLADRPRSFNCHIGALYLCRLLTRFISLQRWHHCWRRSRAKSVQQHYFLSLCDDRHCMRLKLSLFPTWHNAACPYRHGRKHVFYDRMALFD